MEAELSSVSSVIEAAPTLVTDPDSQAFDDKALTENRRPGAAGGGRSRRRCSRARRWSTRGTTSRCWAWRATRRPPSCAGAHEQITRELAPEAIDDELSAELGERLDAMREVVAEALRVLSNDSLRSRYLAHLG